MKDAEYYINKFQKLAEDQCVFRAIQELDGLIDLYEKNNLQFGKVFAGKDFRFRNRSPKVRLMSSLQSIRDANRRKAERKKDKRYGFGAHPLDCYSTPHSSFESVDCEPNL